MEGYGYQVVNASVSGETTAGGLARLPRALDFITRRSLFSNWAANDGLRALPIAQMRANLTQMVELASAAGAKTLLLGMRMPPNYGPEYTGQFALVFSDLARAKKIPWVPFLLTDIAFPRPYCRAMTFIPTPPVSRYCSRTSGRRSSRCCTNRQAASPTASLPQGYWQPSATRPRRHGSSTCRTVCRL